METFYVVVANLGRRMYEWADRRLEQFYPGTPVEHVRAAGWDR